MARVRPCVLSSWHFMSPAMKLGYTELATNLVIWFGPVIALICAAFFAFTICSASRAAIVAKAQAVLGLGLTFIALTTACGVFNLKFYEGASAVGALVCTSSSIKWVALSWLAGIVGFFAFCASKSTSNQCSPELPLAALTLLWVWTLVCLTRTFFTFILLLELAGLLLGILLGYSCLRLRTDATNGGIRSENTQALHALLTFLWVSVFALFVILWSLGALKSASPALDYSLSSTVGVFSQTLLVHRLAALCLGLGFALKLMLGPWQATMLVLYKSIPLSGFLNYLFFYYPGFLIAGLWVFAGHFAVLTAGWVYCLFSVAFLLVLTLIPALNHVHDIRLVLAVSSLLSFFFLFTTIAVSL